MAKYHYSINICIPAKNVKIAVELASGEAPHRFDFTRRFGPGPNRLTDLRDIVNNALGEELANWSDPPPLHQLAAAGDDQISRDLRIVGDCTQMSERAGELLDLLASVIADGGSYYAVIAGNTGSPNNIRVEFKDGKSSEDVTLSVWYSDVQKYRSYTSMVSVIASMIASGAPIDCEALLKQYAPDVLKREKDYYTTKNYKK